MKNKVKRKHQGGTISKKPPEIATKKGNDYVPLLNFNLVKIRKIHHRLLPGYWQSSQLFHPQYDDVPRSEPTSHL